MFYSCFLYSSQPIELISSTGVPGKVRFIVPLKQIDYGVYGDLITIYPKPYSIYFRGTISYRRRK